MHRNTLGLVTLAMSVAAPMSYANEPIQPIEAVHLQSPAKTELGKQLFFDPRLSRSGFISCNSCHNLATGGVDNLPTSIGHGWKPGPVNSPTVLNARFNLAQFWDGRAADLQEQAGGPIANPGEMASTHELAVDVLKSIPGYVTQFKAIYKSDDINMDMVTDAIAHFESTLVTPNSPFDQWLKGDKDAITSQAKAGYQLFKEVGCVSCHYGQAVGGNSYQKMGAIKPWPQDGHDGRFAVTKNPHDKQKFKVPTLRNVELTYPYFHDGSEWDLGRAVQTMAEFQLGRTLNEEQTDQIVAFLKSLTGEMPQLVYPTLPPSQPGTPKPRFD